MPRDEGLLKDEFITFKEIVHLLTTLSESSSPAVRQRLRELLTSMTG